MPYLTKSGQVGLKLMNLSFSQKSFSPSPKQCLKENKAVSSMFQNLQVLKRIIMFTGYSYKLQLLHA